MTSQHPITPPPELVREWLDEIWHEGTPVRVALSDEHIANRAAQWGADQQLAKDAKWLDHNALNEPHLKIAPMGATLKEAMRPKLSSLKEQSLKSLEEVVSCLKMFVPGSPVDGIHINTIRRALEQLDD